MTSIVRTGMASDQPREPIPVYRVMLTVMDEPARADYRVLIAAASEDSAIKRAKAAAIERYKVQAGGWSADPHVDTDEYPPTIELEDFLAFEPVVLAIEGYPGDDS